MIFLSLSLRRHFPGNQVVASRNVGNFFSLLEIKPELLFSYFFVETNVHGRQLNTVFTAKKLV